MADNSLSRVNVRQLYFLQPEDLRRRPRPHGLGGQRLPPPVLLRCLPESLLLRVISTLNENGRCHGLITFISLSFSSTRKSIPLVDCFLGGQSLGLISLIVITLKTKRSIVDLVDESVEGLISLTGSALHGNETGLLLGELGSSVDLHVVFEFVDRIDQAGSRPNYSITRGVVEGSYGDSPSFLLCHYPMGDALDLPIRYHLSATKNDHDCHERRQR